MEDDNLEMGLFDNPNLKFNFDFDSDDTQEDDEIIDDDNKSKSEEIKDAIEEDDIPEDVDGDDVDEDSESGDEDKSSSNLYSSLTKVIHEQGLLPSLDITKVKIETIDDFVLAMKTEQDAQVQLKLDEYISNLDVSEIAQSKKAIEDLSQITEDSLKTNIELAKSIISEDYINQGLDPKKIDKHLKRLIDLGDDAILEDAVESLESLKEFESRKIESQKNDYLKNIEFEKQRQAELDLEIKKNIYERQDLINGLKPNKVLQDKVYKSINEIVGKAPTGEFENKFMRDRRMNPIEFETKMYYIYELTNGFTDYSKLTQSAKSKAVSELEAIARKATIKDNGTPAWAQDGQSYFGKGNLVLNI